MPISAVKLKDIRERMIRIGLDEKDIREHFVRSSGAGGQKVNKASTCVVIKHIPSGLEVKCQIDRSQSVNRFLARRILVERLEKRIFGEKSEAEKRVWKIKKQKRRRSRRANEKILSDKRHHSEKKRLRKMGEDS